MRLAHDFCDSPSEAHEKGRALLARLYREAAGKALPELEKNEWGRPYIPGSSWFFSISHTKHHVFCALSEQNIGIDAEELDRRVNPRLAEKILSSGEYRQYLAADDQNRALLTFWVLKEAAAKRSGRGLRGYPDDTDFSLADGRVTEQFGCLLAILTEEQEKNHAF